MLPLDLPLVGRKIYGRLGWEPGYGYILVEGQSVTICHGMTRDPPVPNYGCRLAATPLN